MNWALKDAGVVPEQVSFVEIHGTRTGVGGPMEVAENSMGQSVVDGDIPEVERFLGKLGEKRIKGIILDATHEFHSRHMDNMLESYGKLGKGVSYAEKQKKGITFL